MNEEDWLKWKWKIADDKNMVKLINYLIGIHILTGLKLKIYLRGLYTKFIPRLMYRLIYYTSKTVHAL